MVKRKCGTCRHFKDGGIAGSGWCQHQARKDIQHMVLVRKTELACRNSWDQDLWELADRPIDLQHSTHIPMPVSGGQPQDIPMIQAASSSDDADRAGEMFTDRITSISMPTRSQLRPGRIEPDEDTDDTAGSDLQGARSSVREARKRRQEQRHLERRKYQETVLQRADDLLDTVEPTDERDRGITRLRASDGPLTANQDLSSETPRESDVPPTIRPNSGQAIPQREPSPSVEFAATPPRFRGTEPPPIQPSRIAPPATPRKEANNGSHPRLALERSETEQLPSAMEVREAVSKQRERRNPPSNAPLDRSANARVEQISATTPPTRVESPVCVSPAGEPRTSTSYTRARSIVHAGAPSPAPAPFEVDPIDLSRDLKTVRRCCATCRDFKQVGDGRTGWCNNPYAFSERRMVQSNEIACRSSLGVWWLPHDDLWLEYADTTHHGRPTPLMDDMVSAVPEDRQGMGQRSSR